MEDKFTTDENGETLRRMAMSGDDLSKARDVDFSILFDDENHARQFFRMISSEGMRASFEQSIEQRPDVWDITATVNMVPTHAQISSMEERLIQLAEPLGGKVDGWGCFAVPKHG